MFNRQTTLTTDSLSELNKKLSDLLFLQRDLTLQMSNLDAQIKSTQEAIAKYNLKTDNKFQCFILSASMFAAPAGSSSNSEKLLQLLKLIQHKFNLTDVMGKILESTPDTMHIIFDDSIHTTEGTKNNDAIDFLKQCHGISITKEKNQHPGFTKVNFSFKENICADVTSHLNLLPDPSPKDEQEDSPNPRQFKWRK